MLFLIHLCKQFRDSVLHTQKNPHHFRIDLLCHAPRLSADFRTGRHCTVIRRHQGELSFLIFRTEKHPL